MGFFDEIGKLFGMGSKNNPSNEANKYLNQIPGTVNPYYQPYINQGQDADKLLMEQYGKLLGNPGALYSELGQGYKESPGYQTRFSEALRGITNAEAAGGMAGSPQHQQYAAQKAVDLRGEDFENYLNHVLGLFGQGLEGQQGYSNRGYGASTGYGDILGSNLGAQAQYGYAGKSAQNEAFNNLLKNIFQGVGTGVGIYTNFKNLGNPSNGTNSPNNPPKTI